MIDPKEYALITVIEGNENSINSKFNPRLLEEEAIKCVKHWRKNAGIYADIDIYCICVSGNNPKLETIEVLNKYDVKYIYHYDKRSEKFKNGWWCKPLGCSVLETVLSHKYLIHIDLDMYLYKPFNFPLNKNSCLVYDSYDCIFERKTSKKFNDKFKPFNTCFMTTIREDRIFSQWFDTLLKLENSFCTDNKYCKNYFNEIEYNKLEEGAFDIVSLYRKNNIKAVEDIMFGETYTPLYDMCNTNNICFHHYHLYNKYDLKHYNFIKDKLLFLNEYA
jgi:hypothetical protein